MLQGNSTNENFLQQTRNQFVVLCLIHFVADHFSPSKTSHPPWMLLGSDTPSRPWKEHQLNIKYMKQHLDISEETFQTVRADFSCIKYQRKERWQTMLQNSTASPWVGFTHIPFTVLPPQLHSPSPAWSFTDKSVGNKRIASKNKIYTEWMNCNHHHHLGLTHQSWAGLMGCILKLEKKTFFF